jgi:sucrose phosphorylase
MFLTFADVFPDGATEAEIARIYRPRPGLCFTPMGVAGRTRLIWTTFTADQVDLCVDHPEAMAYFAAILDRLAAAGVRAVRLDAVGYSVKRAGTSSFMLDETYRFIERLGVECHDRGIAVLVEIHGHHAMAREVADRVDWVYDFATPPLLLHALTTADAAPLRQWIATRPTNAVVVLDTHDGINLTDVARDQAEPSRAGLLDPGQVEALVHAVHERTGGTSRAATGLPTDNRDLYQINTTFFDAVGRRDREYLLGRAVQVFLPGVAQVYYVGLLAGTNDVERFERTGVGRDINRHHYSPAEFRAALGQPVVRQLLALLRWRGSAPVFAGSFTAADGDASILRLHWTAGEQSATLRVDFAAGDFEIELAGPHGSSTVRDLTALPA